MIIRDMFADDINRKINGVIKVDQAADDVIEQELNEYVITKELKYLKQELQLKKMRLKKN